MNVFKNIFIGTIRLIMTKIKIILLIIFIAVLVWFAFDYIDAKKQVALLSDPQAQQQAYQKEVDDTVARISKLIILPEGIPNLSIIQDVKTLAEKQPFFKDAENGDKILIYKDKAIIFSPTRNILVNVGPVYAQDSQAVAVPESKEVTQVEN